MIVAIRTLVDDHEVSSELEEYIRCSSSRSSSSCRPSSSVIATRNSVSETSAEVSVGARDCVA
jgi:hypothetical protein